MKNYIGFGLCLLIGAVVGVAIGLRCGRPCDRAKAVAPPADMVAPPEGTSPELQRQEQVVGQTYRLYQQEMESGETYSTGSIKSAKEALEQLLEEYDRQAQVAPGQGSPAIVMGKAMAHARLARIFLAEGDPMEYERHVVLALELSGEPNEDSLFKKLDLLDQAQQAQPAAP